MYYAGPITGVHSCNNWVKKTFHITTRNIFLFKYNIQEQVIWVVCSNTNVSLEYYIPICPPFFSNTNITRLSKELVRFSISVQFTSLHAA